MTAARLIVPEYHALIRASVIIPTYERPDELRQCVASILSQTVRPTELIIVDDGNLPGIPLREELEGAGIACRYLKKDRPGLTESRNAGLKIATGEVIVFFDDDVTLEPEYIEQLLAVYDGDREREIGGAAGVIVNVRPLNAVHWARFLFNRVFLLTSSWEGRVLASGAPVSFGTTPYPIASRREVEFLPGCGQSYRRAVFDQRSFTDGYRDLAFGEDKDFSFGVSRKWKLVVTPGARLHHHVALNMRPDHRVSGRKHIIGRYLFFSRHVRTGWVPTVLFWYSVSGYFLARFIIALVSFRRGPWSRVWGMLEGLRDIFAGRLPTP